MSERGLRKIIWIYFDIIGEEFCGRGCGNIFVWIIGEGFEDYIMDIFDNIIVEGVVGNNMDIF